jgi:bacterioferritin-associated ferredoxin
VWSRIARLEPRRARRRRWCQGGGLVAAFAVVLLWLVIGRGDQPDELRPRIEVVPGKVAMRSTSARVGDTVRVLVPPADEVRIYRADHLVLRCPVGSSGGGCRSDARGLIAEALIATTGDYQLVIVKAATADPVGNRDRDLGAIVAAGGDYQITELSVR